ncbi:MAG: 16S rRNA (uracil(1498)-N(3))-methyltransferase, partial [Parvularculaceae bacterium]|nr:16S rRNA (uracil(1498)-N(3))-methyltransferase [Parvularculaceae bacterium]
VGAPVRVFNARDGEFEAVIAELGKKAAQVELGARRRAPHAEFDVHLLFAPVKRAAVEAIIQKGVELGVQRFSPVLTERTNAERVRVDRLSAIAMEAAEQCDRLSAPAVDEPAKLATLLERWEADRALVFCDEAGDDPDQPWGGVKGRAAPLQAAVRGLDATRFALMIGPEGGFSPDERARLRAAPYVTPVTLGPRILRADTAAIAALALLQAVKGDLG